MSDLISDLECQLQARFIRPGSVVVDAGANIGEWTQKAMTIRPTCHYHLFEPVLSTYEKLVATLTPSIATHHVRCNPVALGEAPGSMTLFDYPGRPDLNSIYRRTSVESALSLPTPVARTITVQTLDDYSAAAGIDLINFLKVDVEGHELAVLRGAKRLLGRRYVDFIQIEYGGTYFDAGRKIEEVFSEVTAHGYLMLRLERDRLVHYPVFDPRLEDFKYAIYLAVTPRLRRQIFGGPPTMFEYDKVFATYHIEPKGVLHVGAHEGEELANYAKAGCSEVVFIEGDPATFERLRANLAGIDRVRCLNQVVSAEAGTATFRRMSMDQSSSILPLKRHRDIYPSITEASQIDLPTDTLDNLLAREGLAKDRFNILAVDVQGAELLVLQGAKETLTHLQAIIVEVNYEELYEGGALVNQLDAAMEAQGFVRVEEVCAYDASWGDALYLRRQRLAMTTLGRNGRFANQLFQYFFLHRMADELDAIVETPPWIGEQLFHLPIRRVSGTYSPVRQDPSQPDFQHVVRQLRSGRDADVWGYFQGHTNAVAPFREDFRRLFEPRREIKTVLEQGISCLSSTRGKTLVVCHLRRGDYGYGRFFVAPDAWYVTALRALWPYLDAPWLYVASDDLPNVVPAFSEFHPTTVSDLGLNLGDMAYYADFYVQTHAKVLAISNSSFSFAAAMLNRQQGMFLRPDPNRECLVAFDPWNSDILLEPAEPRAVTGATVTQTSPDAYATELAEVQALLQAGEKELARKHLEGYLLSHPTCAEAHNDLAVLFHTEGDLRKALNEAEAAIALAPSEISFHRNHAALLLSAGDPTRAAAALEGVFLLSPRDVDGLVLAGDISIATHRLGDAAEFYSLALKFAPTHTHALQRLRDLQSAPDQATA